MYLIYIIFPLFMVKNTIFSESLFTGDCETLNSEVHIIKDEYSESGQLSRTCNGDISVSKCEGYCNSQVQPSIVTSTGFLKECFCCRELYLKEDTISLDRCYDANGVRLHKENEATMQLKIRVPADCKCIKCGIF